jgi:hypothetical protein
MTKPFIEDHSVMKDANYASKPERGATVAHRQCCQLTTFQFGKCFAILQRKLKANAIPFIDF